MVILVIVMKGYWIILLTTFLIHFFTFAEDAWMKHIFNEKMILLAGVIAKGSAHLLYPLLGLMADILVSRFKVIVGSTFMVTIGPLMIFIVSLLIIVFGPDNPTLFSRQYGISVVMLIFAIGTIGYIGGLGMYEANAIQFGLQQLMEAPSEQLSKFIHWYYWFTTLGQLLAYYVVLPGVEFIKNCQLTQFNAFKNSQLLHISALLSPTVLEIIANAIAIVIMLRCKCYLETHQVKVNPLKTIAKVLLYTYKHKVPERRSAFTFWENSIPSRIDVGKQKYGGPFTNEEVEDVKTFFRLLLLQLSLFGFYLSFDGISLSSFLFKNIGCPSFTLLFLDIANSNHVKQLIILFGIPLYTLCIRMRCVQRYTPNMLTRIGIGMVLCLIHESMYPVFAYTQPNHHLVNLTCDVPGEINRFTGTPISYCFIASAQIQDANGTCFSPCPKLIINDYHFYLPIIVQIIEGLSSLMVFMTVLEFICAQAPYALKGLLIGIWYSMVSIQYLAIDVIDEFIIDASNVNQWTIYHGIKGCGIFISVILYLAVCKAYQYRERDEIVNEQAIIEEQYERELLMNESESLLESLNLNNVYND